MGADRERIEQDVGEAGTVRDVFDATPVGLVALGGDPPRWIAMNRLYREAILQRRGVIGEVVRETLPEIEAQRITPIIARVRETGETYHAREWRFDLATADGPPRTVHLDFLVAPAPAADDPCRLVFVVTDVTERVLERQAAERRAEGAERRLLEMREVVAALQEALLPRWLPVLPGVRLGARYLVAAEDQAAGGDWFDTVVCSDGTLALVVGDVVGHGVAASAAMGRLRAVVHHEVGPGGDGLPEALARIDAFAAGDAALRAATVCVAVLDPASGRLRYATCGHPAPLVVDPAGGTRFLDATGPGPLGTGASAVVAEDALRPGETVLLYTDGLVERPGATLADGAAALARVAGDAVSGAIAPGGAPMSPPDRVCQLTVELLTREGYLDDVTVLAAERRREPVAPVFLEVAGGMEQLAGVRAWFARWLDLLEVAEDDLQALELVVHEAVANAIEHAGGDGARVRIEAALDAGGTLEVRVADDGRWRAPRDGDVARGRGLFLIDQLTDAVALDRGEEGGRGTTVTLRRRVGRPALLASEPQGSGADAPRTPFATGTTPTDAGPWIGARGPVDADAAAALAAEVRSAAKGASLAATLDLSEVTLLASTGVRALFDLRAAFAARGSELRIVARPGGPAAMVLDLVGLPYAPAGEEPPAG